MLENFITGLPLWGQIIFLILGFAFLMKGADLFVDGSSSLADRMGIPQIVIGLTIVAFGTSAPEAAISITAGIQKSADLAVSNVLGSNILNIMLILGISSLIIPLAVKKTTFKYEIPFVAAITVLLLVLGLAGNNLSRIDGIIFLVLLAGFMVYLVMLSKKNKSDESEEIKKLPVWKMILFIILGAAGIILGSEFTVDSAKQIAASMGMSQRIIGLTIVALGTSLPELITSVTAARKHNADIAIGNVVGSNIFNILFVLGVTAAISPVSYDNAFICDNIMALLAMIILFVCILLNKDKKLGRTGGIILLASYILYFVIFILNPFGISFSL
ncbi:MAG: calcium/sodium antiporter [Butyrivibrio sp.]